MADARVAAGQGGIVLDLQADFGHAGRVDPPQHFQAVDFVAAADGDLAALVHLQDVVADFEELDVGDPAGQRHQPVHMGRRVGENDDVALDVARDLAQDADLADVAARFAEPRQEAAEGPGHLPQAAAEGPHDFFFPPHGGAPWFPAGPAAFYSTSRKAYRFMVFLQSARTSIG